MRTLRRYQCSNGHRFNMAGIIETIRQRNAVTGDVTSSWRERHDWPTACVTCGSTSIRRNGKDIAVTAGSASCGRIEQ